MSEVVVIDEGAYRQEDKVIKDSVKVLRKAGSHLAALSTAEAYMNKLEQEACKMSNEMIAFLKNFENLWNKMTNSMVLNLKMKMPEVGKYIASAIIAGLAINISSGVMRGLGENSLLKISNNGEWEALLRKMKSAYELMPGGEAPNMSSVINAAGLFKSSVEMAGAFKTAGELFGKSAGKTILGKIGEFGQLAAGGGTGAASMGSGAALGVGLVSIIGGLLSLNAVGSIIDDSRKADMAASQEERNVYSNASSLKLAAALMGGFVGLLAGNLPGALIGMGAAGTIAGILVDKEKKQELLKIEQDKYFSPELKAALAAGVTGADFEKKFLEVVEKDMKNRFGKVKLTLEEIKKKASEIVFGKQIKAAIEFSRATQETADSLLKVEDLTRNMESFQWKAEIGMEFSSEDIQEYKETADAFAESIKEYLENKHYEATMAVQFLMPQSTLLLSGINESYAYIQEELASHVNNLQNLMEEAEKDGYTNERKEAISAEVENIIGIKNQVEKADEQGYMKALEARYGGTGMTADSFALLLESLREQNGQYEESSFNAYRKIISSLELEKASIDKEGNPLLSDEEAKSQETMAHITYYLQTKLSKMVTEDQGYNELASKFKDVLTESIAKEKNIIQDNVTMDDMREKLKRVVEYAVDNEVNLLDSGKFKEIGLEDFGEDRAYALMTFLDEIAKFNPEYLETVVAKREKEADGSTGMSGSGSEAADQYMEEFAVAILKNMDTSLPVTMRQVKYLADQYLQDEFSTGMAVSTNVTIRANFTLEDSYSTETSGSSGNGTGKGDDKVNVLDGNANGGFIHGARKSWIGEDGPEVIIPLGEKRRARGMSLWKQTGEMLGYHALLNYGHSGNTVFEDEMYNNTSFDNNTSSIAYSPTEKQSAPPVQVAVSAAPVININGNQSDSDIVNTIRSHIRDLADDMCGEIADKITVVFSNMPQNA